MSDHSAIEWTDATWNPVTGCTRVSPGCAHCYIERTPPFRMEGRRFVNGTTGVRLHPDRLDQPMRWRKPRRVFVCSLADLFHDEVPDDYIARVFAAMALASQHTFQVLTKRPERARALLDDVFRRDSFQWWAEHFVGDYAPDLEVTWPLPNVWVGVSIENARHTWRADVLREIPAAVRFISAEPLLGSLFPHDRLEPGTTAARSIPSQPPSRDGVPLSGRKPGSGIGAGQVPSAQVAAGVRKPLDLTGIDWVIVGGESGPGARPMHPDWARELRDACRCPDCNGEGWGVELGHDSLCWQTGNCTCGGVPEQVPCDPCGGTGRRVAYFFKQWGEHLPRGQRAPGLNAFGGDDYHRVGKKRAGRLLDGRTWDETPTVRT